MAQNIEQLKDAIYWASRLGFSRTQIYGYDNEINTATLYQSAMTRVASSASPSILLITQDKFNAIALKYIWQKHSFRTTLCFSGRQAYTEYLRHSSRSFDLVIVEWDLPDVGGRDLVHYVREDGGQVCIAALLGKNGTSARTALRSGADLFFRKPLYFHTNILRSILLPGRRLPGFPHHILQQAANFSRVRGLLSEVAVPPSAADVNALIDEANRDFDMVDETNFKEMTYYLQRIADERASFVRMAAESPQARGEGQSKKLLRVLDAVVGSWQDAKKTISEQALEIRNLKVSLSAYESVRGRRQSTYSVIGAENTLTEMEATTLSKPDLVAHAMAVQRQLSATERELELIHADYLNLAEQQTKVDAALQQLSEGSPTFNTNSPGAPALSLTVPTDTVNAGMLMPKPPPSPLQKPLSPLLLSGKSPRHSRPLSRNRQVDLRKIHERLETHLMTLEDTYLAKKTVQDMRSVQTVPHVSLPWVLSLPTDHPLSSLYDLLIDLLRAYIRDTNSYIAKMVLAHPQSYSRAKEFSSATHRLLAASTVPLVFLKTQDLAPAASLRPVSPSIRFNITSQNAFRPSQSTMDLEAKMKRKRTQELLAEALSGKREGNLVLRSYSSWHQFVRLRRNSRTIEARTKKQLDELEAQNLESAIVAKNLRDKLAAVSDTVSEERATAMQLKVKLHQSEDKCSTYLRQYLQKDMNEQVLQEEIGRLKKRISRGGAASEEGDESTENGAGPAQAGMSSAAEDPFGTPSHARAPQSPIPAPPRRVGSMRRHGSFQKQRGAPNKRHSIKDEAKVGGAHKPPEQKLHEKRQRQRKIQDALNQGRETSAVQPMDVTDLVVTGGHSAEPPASVAHLPPNFPRKQHSEGRAVSPRKSKEGAPRFRSEAAEAAPPKKPKGDNPRFSSDLGSRDSRDT